VLAKRVVADLPVFLPPEADAYLFIDSGRQALSHPGTIYATSAALIAAGHPWTITWPPPQVLLAVPFALLPAPAGVWLWVATNALLAIAGLYWIYRASAPAGRNMLPVYVLAVLCFTPLFEDIRLGQRGGALIFLAGAAMFVVQRNPLLAGVLAGLGTAIKFYPAAMAGAVAPSGWWRFSGALGVTGALVLGLSFIPFGNPIQYLAEVLLPVALGSPQTTHDCFQNSTPLLFSRLVGGTSFSRLSTSGVWTDITLVPWHMPLLAQVLTYATILALVLLTVWASWRSGWEQPFSMSLAFSLGALIPGDVYTYQFIAVMPLTLVLLMKVIDRHRWWTVALIGTALWTFESSPCALVVPGLWTIAGLGIFSAAVIEANRFRGDTDDGFSAGS
jgi:hypothetical protein